MRLTGNPVGRIALAALLGVASHMALDAIPHSEYRFMPLDDALKVALVEILVMIPVVVLIARRRGGRDWLVPLAAGIGASMLPDVKFGAHLFLSAKAAAVVERVGDSFHFFHTEPHSHHMLGLVAEITITGVCFALIVRLSRPVFVAAR